MPFYDWSEGVTDDPKGLQYGGREDHWIVLNGERVEESVSACQTGMSGWVEYLVNNPDGSRKVEDEELVKEKRYGRVEYVRAEMLHART